MTLHDEATSLLGLGGNKGAEEGRNADGEVHPQATSGVKARESLFMLLYLVGKDARTSTGVAFVTWTINMLQLLAFAFDGKHFRWHHAADTWLAPKLAWINFAVLKSSPDVLLPAFLVSFGLVVLTALGCLYIGWQFWASGTVTNVSMLPMLQTTVRLLTTVLYVPMISILTAVFMCNNDALEDLVPCGGPGRLALIVCTAVVLLSFIVFNCIAVLVFVDDNPESQHAMAQVHGRVACAYLAVRAALSLLFVIFDGSSAVLTAAVFSAGVLTTGMYLLYLPFHRQLMNQLVVGSNAVFLWAGVCLIMAEYIGDKNDLGAFLGFLSGAAPVAYAAAMMVRQREDRLATETLHKHLSPYVAELMCRFRLRPRKANWREVGQEYRDLLDHFPLDPFLTLHVANLYLVCGDNTVLSGQYIRRARVLAGLRMDHRFALFKHTKRQQEKANGTEGALSFVAFTHHRKNAERTLIDVLRQVHRLWSLVARGSEAEELFFAANEIHRLSKTAKTHLNKLVSISQSSRRSLLLYALYAEEVTQDTRLARRLRRMADGASRMGESTSDENAALITIVGDDSEELGNVVEVSDSAEKLLGYSRQAIIGRNISELAPEPIRSVHNDILRAYVENNTGLGTGVRRKVWILHNQGYVVPVELKVSSHQSSTGMLRHTAVFNELRSDDELVAVRGSDWELLFFSKGLMRDFGLVLVDGGAPLTSFIPQVADILTPADATATPVRATLDQGDVSYIITMLRPPFHSSAFEDVDMVMLRFSPPIFSGAAADDDDDGGGGGGGGGESINSPASPASPGSGRFMAIPGSVSECGDPFPGSGRNVRGSFGASSVRGGSPGPGLASPKPAGGSHYGGPGGDGASSVGSSSTVNQSASLRRVVMQRIEQETVRHERFRRLMMVLGLLYGSLALASMVAQFILDNQISLLLELGILAAERTSLVCTIGSVMLSHVMGTMGFLTVPESGLRAKVKELAVRLREVHSLTTQSEARSIPEQLELLDNGGVIQFFDSNAAHSRPRSLDTAVAKMIAAAETFAGEAHVPGLNCSKSCRTVLNNGAYETLDVALLSSRIFFDETLDAMRKLDLVNMSFLVISACVLFAVLAFRLLPVLLEIRRTRGALSHALASVPSAMIKQLREQSSQRVESVKASIDEINGVTVQDDEEDQKDQLTLQLATMNRSRSRCMSSLKMPAGTRVQSGVFSTRGSRGGNKVLPLPPGREQSVELQQRRAQELAILDAARNLAGTAAGGDEEQPARSPVPAPPQEAPPKAKQDEVLPPAVIDIPDIPDLRLSSTSITESRRSAGMPKPQELSGTKKAVSVRTSIEQGPQGVGSSSSSSNAAAAAAAAAESQKRMLKKVVANRLNKKADPVSLLRRVRAHTGFLMDCMRLCLPMFVVLIYFGTLVVTSRHKIATLGPYSQTMFFVGKRWVLTTRLIFQMDLTSIEFEPEWGRWRAELSPRSPEQWTQLLHDELLHTTSLILYPNEAAGTLPMVNQEEWPDAYHMEFVDACLTDACRTAPPNLSRLNLERGLSTALDSLIEIVEAVLEGDHSHDSIIRFYEDEWLREASAEYMKICSNSVLELAASARRTAVVFCVAFLATLVLVLSWVSRAFRQVNNELKNSQYVLLMLPAEILTSAAGLQDLLKLNNN